MRVLDPPSLSGGSPLQQLVGRRVRRRRLEQHLTLAAVAASAGMRVGFLSRIETGHRATNIKTLAGLCRVLGIRMEDLLDPHEEPAARVVEFLHPFVEHAPGLFVQHVSDPDDRRLLIVNAVLQSRSRCSVQAQTGQGPLTGVQMEGASFLRGSCGEYLLGAGDALTLAPGTAMVWANQRAHVSRVLWIGDCPGSASAVFGRSTHKPFVPLPGPGTQNCPRGY
ncbi:helix-turn-helix domain-containing protein [Neomicrococcus lactis]